MLYYFYRLTEDKMKDNELLLDRLTEGQSQRAWLILTNKYPNKGFFKLLWTAQDTNYLYNLYVMGRANAEIRAYAAGVKDTLLAQGVR